LTCGHWDNSFKVISLDGGDMVQSNSQHKDVVTSLSGLIMHLISTTLFIILYCGSRMHVVPLHLALDQCWSGTTFFMISLSTSNSGVNSANSRNL